MPVWNRNEPIAAKRRVKVFVYDIDGQSAPATTLFTGTNELLVDGVFWEYDRGTTTNWRVGTCSNSTCTMNTTSPAQAVGTGWAHLKAWVNAGATSVTFRFNDTDVNTHTTNIPTGSGREMAFGCHIHKQAGTSARSISMDYVYLKKYFDTRR
jgi:hypothetical protein